MAKVCVSFDKNKFILLKTGYGYEQLTIDVAASGFGCDCNVFANNCQFDKKACDSILSLYLFRILLFCSNFVKTIYE